jgi:hypothetical protein
MLCLVKFFGHHFVTNLNFKTVFVDYVCLKRSDYHMRAVRKALRELCAEARKRLKKTSNSVRKPATNTEASTSEPVVSIQLIPSSDSDSELSSIATTVVLPTNSQNSNDSSKAISSSSSQSSSSPEPYTRALSKLKEFSQK